MQLKTKLVYVVKDVMQATSILKLKPDNQIITWILVDSLSIKHTMMMRMVNE